MAEGLDEIKHLRHVVWDWNGTLLDDVGLSLVVVNEMLSRRGLPRLDLKRYREVFCFPIRKYYERIGFDFDRDPFPTLAEEFVTRYYRQCHTCDLHDGVRTVLAIIRDQGRSQSILSASHAATLAPIIHRYGLGEYFSKINGLKNHHAAGKLEAGKEWLETERIDPGTVLLIGDTEHDAEVAAALGMSFILVSWGHQSGERLNPHGLVVDTPRGLEEIFIAR